MKNMNKKIWAILLILLVGVSGCDDSFLNLAPKDELSEATAFSTYDNVKVYSWKLYEFFQAYDDVNGYLSLTDQHGDLMENGGASNGNNYLWARYDVPANSSSYSTTYDKIRKTNIMLDNLKNSSMSEEDIAHWRSVALFFRSHEYFYLLQQYGGVLWLENAVKENDERLYGPRSTRDEVADNILRDLTEAEANIKAEGDGPNTINKNVVRALLSRFGLFEGTWRKYHNLGNHEKFLNASIAASEKLMVAFPTLIPVYDHVFNSANLAGKPGIILYKHYEQDVVWHNMSTNQRSTNQKMDITRKGIDIFLCKDGKPIGTSPLYKGDKDKYNEFKNRDTRILVMTPPPYKINGDGSVDKWTHTGNPDDAQWFPELVRVTGGAPNKYLPDQNWAGRATGEVPNFNKLLPTQTSTGYRFWKFYNEVSYRLSSRDFNDAPIYRIDEVLVNYAEAMFEMGKFDQSVADATINKLRVRGEVAPMQVSEINASFDPARDTSVDPVLWEIRRERATELMGEGFRREDLRRWKKMNYAAAVKLGRWVKKSEYPTANIQDKAQEGYVQFVPGTPPAFPEHYYLFPLPSDELVLNDQLKQNPGWPGITN